MRRPAHPVFAPWQPGALVFSNNEVTRPMGDYNRRAVILTARAILKAKVFSRAPRIAPGAKSG